MTTIPLEPTIAVIGLGYVGLPLAVEFGKSYPTTGFDSDAERITELRHGLDGALEVGDAGLARAGPPSMSVDSPGRPARSEGPVALTLGANVVLPERMETDVCYSIERRNRGPWTGDMKVLPTDSRMPRRLFSDVAAPPSAEDIGAPAEWCQATEARV